MKVIVIARSRMKLALLVSNSLAQPDNERLWNEYPEALRGSVDFYCLVKVYQRERCTLGSLVKDQ